MTVSVEKFVRSYVAALETLNYYRPDQDSHYKRIAAEMYEKLDEFDQSRMSSIFETIASFDETEEDKDRQSRERSERVPINW